MRDRDKVKANGRRYYERHRERISERHKQARAADPEKFRQRAKRDYDADPAKVRNNTLKRRYGITQEDYARLSAVQDHSCAICRVEGWMERYGVLHVDHNHQTGEVRGLLCDRCNVGLGRFRDDPDLLVNALTYLKAEDRVPIEYRRIQ